jgi:polyisoprenoid-binding protein YceI
MDSLIDSSSVACHAAFGLQRKRHIYIGRRQPMRPPSGIINTAILAHRRLQLPAMQPMKIALVALRPELARAAPGVALIVAACCLAACHGAPAVGARAAHPPGAAVPAAPALPAMPVAIERYRIDSQRSVVLILIYRDGRMAALGHNHVIAVRDLSGDIILAADVTQSSWQLDFPVAALSVDEPQLRAAQGADFQSAVDEVAIAGTRDHMLGPALLDAAHFPTIHLQSLRLQLRSAAARSEDQDLVMTSRILVCGHSAEVQLPVSLQHAGDELIASGEFDLTHAQLGLTPYSVALGALRVAERMHVRFRLVARRTSDAPTGSVAPH